MLPETLLTWHLPTSWSLSHLCLSCLPPAPSTRKPQRPCHTSSSFLLLEAHPCLRRSLRRPTALSLSLPTASALLNHTSHHGTANLWQLFPSTLRSSPRVSFKRPVFFASPVYIHHFRPFHNTKSIITRLRRKSRPHITTCFFPCDGLF